MDEATTRLLFDITLMLIVAGICSIGLKRLKLPTIIGYLMAGILLGPHVFTQVVVQQSTVDVFSSLGIVLLMFFIGLELNLRGLKKVASYAMIIVTIEMSVMIIVGYLLGHALGLDSAQALFLGVTISCASTAVVLGVMRENEHMQGKLSKAVTGILIMEDIGLIVILALTDPIIDPAGSGSSPALTFLLIIIFIAMTVILGLALVPRFLDWVDRHYSGETLFIVAVGIGFGLALAASVLGLSEAIGAFLGGIIVSQALCSSTVCHRVEPMKEMFMAIFFISIGFQLDPALMISGLPLAIIIAAVFIGAKVAGVSIGSFAANFKTRSGFLIATSMVAMGEFTFVVAKVALDGGLIGTSLYSSVIGAALITMLLLPIISRSSPQIFDAVVSRLPKGVFKALDRLENTRLEARERMARSVEVRKKIRSQVYQIFVDFVIIISILLAVNLLSVIKDAALSVSSGNSTVAGAILLSLSLLLIIPAAVHLAKRLRIIAITFAQAAAKAHGHGLEARARTYRMFMNLWSAIVFMVLLIVIFPLLPQVEGLPVSPIEIVIFFVIVVWLAWNTINSAYDRISASLSKSLTELEADGPGDEAEVPH